MVRGSQCHVINMHVGAAKWAEIPIHEPVSVAELKGRIVEKRLVASYRNPHYFDVRLVQDKDGAPEPDDRVIDDTIDSIWVCKRKVQQAQGEHTNIEEQHAASAAAPSPPDRELDLYTKMVFDKYINDDILTENELSDLC